MLTIEQLDRRPVPPPPPPLLLLLWRLLLLLLLLLLPIVAWDYRCVASCRTAAWHVRRTPEDPQATKGECRAPLESRLLLNVPSARLCERTCIHSRPTGGSSVKPP